jgi:hypothetical protein
LHTFADDGTRFGDNFAVVIDRWSFSQPQRPQSLAAARGALATKLHCVSPFFASELLRPASARSILPLPSGCCYY